MGIRDDVGEISENNVTIAETQEKVYNAGVRAGMMQDPDYSEGYEDGYEQGLSDSSGVVWEDLLSGKVPVGKAKEADHADKATNADHAESATFAGHAITAESATNADRATGANHATEADHSVEADHATEADRSVEADHATNADKANTAVSAGHATTAAVANSTNSFNGVLPIENGGTGGDTPAAALNNLGAASIVTGSYVGTGTVGESNPNTLIFDSPVKMLIIMPALISGKNKVYYAPMVDDGYYDSGEDDDDATPLFLFGKEFIPIVSGSSAATHAISVEQWGTTVQWYSIGIPSYQRNQNGCTYHYIAFLG